MKKTLDILIIGLALFAIFLGAGNILLPPHIGYMTGSSWGEALSGFLLTGVVAPIIVIISMGQCSGDLMKMTRALPKPVDMIFVTILILLIGPLIAVPRTAAVTYELAVAPFDLGVPPLAVSIVFFTIVLFFVLSPSSIVDKIGKYLTPFLVTILAFLIIKGFIDPIGTAVESKVAAPFTMGLKQGYQTMDVLTSMVVAIIIIRGIRLKGYTSNKAIFSITLIAGLIAGTGLFAVYSGLMNIGASGSGVLPAELSNSRSGIIVNSIHKLLGSTGNIILGLTITTACLTTAIGLIATASRFFHEKLNKYFSFPVIVLVMTGVSLFLSVIGVDEIIRFSAPVLEIIYPITIIIVIMNLFSKWIPNKLFVIGALVGTLSVVIIQSAIVTMDIINEGHFSIEATLSNFINLFPLANLGFPWLLPAVVVSLIFGFGYMVLKRPANKTA